MNAFKIAKDAWIHAEGRFSPETWATMSDGFAADIKVAFAIQHVVINMVAFSPEATTVDIKEVVEFIQRHYRVEVE